MRLPAFCMSVCLSVCLSVSKITQKRVLRVYRRRDMDELINF